MIYVSMLLIFLPLILITSITPYITRKTESFGVSIPSDMFNHSSIKQYRKQYTTQSSLIGIILVIIIGLLAKAVTEETWVIFYTVGIFAYMIITFFVYYQFHKKMKELKEKENWKVVKKEVVAVDLSFYKQKLTYSNVWFIIPFFITVISFIWTFLNYDRIPEKIPMQYSLDGTVTNWVDKSIGSVLTFPLIQLFMLGVFIYINIVIGRSKQQMDPANPKESIKQNMIFRRRWSLYMIISGTMMILLFVYPQISFVYPINPTLSFIITLVVVGIMVIWAAILSITTGQGGSRVKVAANKRDEVMNRDDDQFWKLGVFYFNPDDPSVWLEKRFGSGWTVNFARPTAWLFLLLTILIPIAIAIFSS
ncbi:DUF1648 domain-containing protein [Bacillus andreraoultii]|uniref:DUF1648 domain-containing protein n=1 Tax=Bacillus andreraoultii TaxID=1499685 RepID=UPI00053AECC1|nr:DUF5808 domain-containing protein [Bacillus andreraoultii]